MMFLGRPPAMTFVLLNVHWGAVTTSLASCSFSAKPVVVLGATSLGPYRTKAFSSDEWRRAGDEQGSRHVTTVVQSKG
ncbi:hypothetical protein OG21DRAFT_1207223 [Imleria badia]|nr:hypothetical protein OG21DRAFT_1207223 [Imleria badia]